MSIRQKILGSSGAWLGCALLGIAVTGCQSTIGGQTLPSAHFLLDDIQYYPAGPEFRLTRQAEAMEQYKLRESGVSQDEISAPNFAPPTPPAPESAAPATEVPAEDAGAAAPAM